MNKGFFAACAAYFGRKDGQTLADFKNEISELTAKDCADLQPMLSVALGCPVDLPVKAV